MKILAAALVAILFAGSALLADAAAEGAAAAAKPDPTAEAAAQGR